MHEEGGAFHIECDCEFQDYELLFIVMVTYNVLFTIPDS